QAHVQERALTGGEQLGAVASVAMRADVPGLVLEEFRVGGEGRQEPGQTTDVAQAGAAPRGTRLRRERRIRPQRVVVMVAGYDGEGQLAGDQAEALGRTRDLEVADLGVGLARHARARRVWDPPETAGLVLRVHPL